MDVDEYSQIVSWLLCGMDAGVIGHDMDEVFPAFAVSCVHRGLSDSPREIHHQTQLP